MGAFKGRLRASALSGNSPAAGIAGRTSPLRDHRARRKSVGDTLRKFSAVLRSKKVPQARLAAELLDTLEQLCPSRSWTFTQQSVSKYVTGGALPGREVMIGLLAAIDKLTDGQVMNMPILASTLLLDAGRRGLEAPEVLAAFSHRFADGDFVPTRRATAQSMDKVFIAPIADFFQLDFDTGNARVDLYRPLRNIGKEVYRSLQESDDRQLYSPADDLSSSANSARLFGRCFKRLLDDHTDLRSNDVDRDFVEECDRLYPDGAKESRRDGWAALTASPQRWSAGECLPRNREALIAAFSVMARSPGATILPIHFDMLALYVGFRGLEERELRAIFGHSDIDCDRLSELALSTADRKEIEKLVRAEYGALAVQRKMQPLLYWAYETTTKEMAAGEGFDRRRFLRRFAMAQGAEKCLNQYPTERALQMQFLEEYVHHLRNG